MRILQGRSIPWAGTEPTTCEKACHSCQEAWGFSWHPSPWTQQPGQPLTSSSARCLSLCCAGCSFPQACWLQPH
ncbi:Hypothetical predicted protein [Lynx pardinus]|uniref:Uncharacterized protein n=1 Tax=Lynx pardinus TaxID=191816 RepID=A0A485N153_LYNPA|nr:Hypothetical predicted protein [Lynx pardinus]